MAIPPRSKDADAETTPPSKPSAGSTADRPQSKVEPAKSEEGADVGRSAGSLSSKSSGDEAEPDDEAIRRLAYEIWESEGRQTGRDEEYWHRARAKLRSGTRSGSM
jgi:Protein of unknown function (DUF2934)